MTYQQGPGQPWHQGQQGQWQQPGYGPPGQPPPKSNTGVIVTLSIVVVLLLGTLAVTGFVAPGFLLSDKDDPSAGDRPPPTAAPSQEVPTAPPAGPATPGAAPVPAEGAGGQERIDEFFADVLAGDAVGAQEQLCKSAKPTYGPEAELLAEEKVDASTNVDHASERQVKAWFLGHTTADEVTNVEGWISARNSDDEWCIESVDVTGP